MARERPTRPRTSAPPTPARPGAARSRTEGTGGRAKERDRVRKRRELRTRVPPAMFGGRMKTARARSATAARRGTGPRLQHQHSQTKVENRARVGCPVSPVPFVRMLSVLPILLNASGRNARFCSAVISPSWGRGTWDTQVQSSQRGARVQTVSERSDPVPEDAEHPQLAGRAMRPPGQQLPALACAFSALPQLPRCVWQGTAASSQACPAQDCRGTLARR
jgi:hypothetical protein